MKILVVSDAWRPQVNGVVRTYEHLREELEAMGHVMPVIGPADFHLRVPMPGYPEIQLALAPGPVLRRMIEGHAPDHLHIATEGPLGRAARRYCLRRGVVFSTAYHTHFPKYLARRMERVCPPLAGPAERYAIHRMREFHAPSAAVMVATPGLEHDLRNRGFAGPMRQMTRGVNTGRFYPGQSGVFAGLPRPVALYAGRVAVEKNVEDFLRMDWPGSKVVVGAGPETARLQRAFPEVLFTGVKTGEDLAAHYRGADIFVFPSKTDTFGMVLVEALACGLPIAAYDVRGPGDIVTEPVLGAVDDNLSRAAQAALHAPGSAEDRHNHVRTHYTWRLAAEQFLEGVR